MRVIVADDSLLIREGIVRLLGDAGVEVVAELADATALLDAVAALVPDGVVLDIRMPPTHTDEGLVAALRIREQHPDIGVLVLSQYVEPSFALRLLQDNPGGVGYLLKDRVADTAALVDALRRVLADETVVDPMIVSSLLGRRRPPGPLDALSPREREVLGLVAEGLSNQEIARRLFVTDRTVEAHTHQVFTKLGLAEDPSTNRRVLAALAYLRAD